MAGPLVALTGPAGLDAQSWYGGASIHNARIPAPFSVTSHCFGGYESVTIDAVVGPALHVTRLTGSGVDLTVHVAAMTSGRERFRYANCPNGGADDVRHLAIYHGEVDADWTQAAELAIGYSPPTIPFRAAVGAGWIRGTGLPYATAMIGIRTLTRIRGFIDISVRSASVPYTLYEEEWRACEPDWDCDRYVARETVGSGRDWAAGRDLRVGIEIPFRR